MTPNTTKVGMRRMMLRTREDIDAATRRQAAFDLALRIDDLAPWRPSERIVASYRAMGAECDPGPLTEALRVAGAAIALPVTPTRGQPLVFRHWPAGGRLVPHAFGMEEPVPELPAVRPDLLLVPLLAFDREGYRLGYGGGFYDRTLACLRRDGRGCVAIGVSFCEQEVDAVPHDAYDEKLDAVVTPAGVVKFGA